MGSWSLGGEELKNNFVVLGRKRLPKQISVIFIAKKKKKIWVLSPSRQDSIQLNDDKEVEDCTICEGPVPTVHAQPHNRIQACKPWLWNKSGPWFMDRISTFYILKHIKNANIC